MTWVNVLFEYISLLILRSRVKLKKDAMRIEPKYVLKLFGML